MKRMRVLKALYRGSIANTQAAIIQSNCLDSLVKGVFGEIDAVRKVTVDSSRTI